MCVLNYTIQADDVTFYYYRDMQTPRYKQGFADQTLEVNIKILTSIDSKILINVETKITNNKIIQQIKYKSINLCNCFRQLQ